MISVEDLSGYITEWAILVRTQHEESESLHNHGVHGACKVASSVLQEITQAVINNPSLLPTDVSKGKGLKFVPSAVDGASAHLGKVSRIVTNAGKLSPAYSSKWFVEEFETIADEIDSKDEQYTQVMMVKPERCSLSLNTPISEQLV